MIRYRTQLLLLVAGLCLACYFGTRVGGGHRQELNFKDGPTALVDAVWQQETVTWTLREGIIQAYPSKAITRISAQHEPFARSGLSRLRAHWWRLRWYAFVLCNTQRPLGRAWPPRHLDYLLWVLMGVIGLSILVVVRSLARRENSGTGAAQTAPQETDSQPDQPSSGGVPSLNSTAEVAGETPQDQIVAFFLQIFQAQCAPGRPAKTSFGVSGAKGPHGTTIFNLQVMSQGKVHRRRMSIGPLGPGHVGSSLCFFVIYDLQLVVKLPRKPIQDYALYIESIDKERQIAALLERVPAIVPRVATILENVHRFNDHETLSKDAIEQRYIGWMRRNPAFQRYLKVGESFAFFMELSSHHFLHHVLGDIHLSDAGLRQEMRDYGHLIWKPHEFIGRYGAGAQPVCAQLQGLYQNCRRSLNLPTHPNNRPAPQVPDYEHKKAFLASLSCHLLGTALVDRSSDDAAAMHSLVGEQAGMLGHYRHTLTRYLRKTLFQHHRQQIGALVTNTLRLTATLYERRIALRDLKPENLLVVGKRANFPAFLKQHRRFRLGLIDFETATASTERASSDAVGEGLLSAPKPGGTPLYATPSHFLKFDQLSRIYADPFEVLMEQDWYAAIAICFRAVTGEHLWDGTAGLFPAMVETIASIDPADKGEALDSLFSKLSWVFWSNARMEFYDKLRKHRPSLTQVRVDLPPRCVETIRHRVDRCIQRLQDALSTLLGSHAKLEEVVRHLQLTDATAEQIRLLRTTWEMDATDESKQTHRLSDRFRELEGLTQNLEVLEKGRSLLEHVNDGLGDSLDLPPLLTILFTHCLSVMYKGGWKGLGHRRIDWHEALVDEPSYTQTL
jgi:serine/threonine protein kinase